MRDQQRRIAEYLEFARTRPELFPEQGRAIRILLDPDDIAGVENDMVARLQALGLPVSGAEVGIVCHDPYFILLRDAVEFPDGSRRTYSRRINRGTGAVAILPVLGGRLVLVRHFRHAPGRFLLEIPRGAIEGGQSAEEAVRGEIAEEIGGEVEQVVRLGFLYDSTGMNYDGLNVYLARLSKIGAPETAEGIESIELFTAAEFEAKLAVGDILDSVTVTAYCHAKVRGLLMA
jgi:ADP-ribose pyrophosphatase